MASDAIRSVIDNDLGILKTSLPYQLSASGDAVTTTSYAADLVVKDKALSFRDSVPVLNTAVAYYLIDTSGYIGDDIYCLPIRMTSTAGRFDVVLTQDFTYTVASNSPDIFRRKGLVIENGSSVKVYRTITDLVILSSPLKYPMGGESTNQSSGGGTVAGDSIFTLTPANNLLIAVTNNSGQDAFFGIQLDWYEG